MTGRNKHKLSKDNHITKMYHQKEQKSMSEKHVSILMYVHRIRICGAERHMSRLDRLGFQLLSDQQWVIMSHLLHISCHHPRHWGYKNNCWDTHLENLDPHGAYNLEEMYSKWTSTVDFAGEVQSGLNISDTRKDMSWVEQRVSMAGAHGLQKEAQ